MDYVLGTSWGVEERLESSIEIQCFQRFAFSLEKTERTRLTIVYNSGQHADSERAYPTLRWRIPTVLTSVSRLKESMCP